MVEPLFKPPYYPHKTPGKVFGGLACNLSAFLITSTLKRSVQLHKDYHYKKTSPAVKSKGRLFMHIDRIYELQFPFFLTSVQ